MIVNQPELKEFLTDNLITGLAQKKLTVEDFKAHGKMHRTNNGMVWNFDYYGKTFLKIRTEEEKQGWVMRVTYMYEEKYEKM